MKQVILKLHGIKLQNFDPNSGNAKFRIEYSVDGDHRTFEEKMVLDKPKPLVRKIFAFVKEEGNVDLSDVDDFVGSLFVKTLVNEEQIEETILNFFSRLCEQARVLKKESDHATYMKIFDEIKISELRL